VRPTSSRLSPSAPGPAGEGIAEFQQRLLAWYARHHRRLPWRETSDAYPIWVSEVMLQQTQVAAVIPYYERFMANFPAVARLATADLQEVLKTWEGLGYYARARNLHRAARLVVNEHGGRIPPSWDGLRRLPGVGDYIAAAVLSIAFGQPHAVVDGNVKRVLARLQMIAEPVNRSTSHRTFRTAAEGLLYRSDPGRFNQAMMELGALICKPARPACDRCPVDAFCRARRAECTQEYPRRAARRPTPLYRIAIGIVRDGERLLITRRRAEGLLGGLWEFPGGKIRPGESAESACVREILEEVGLRIDIESRLAGIRHAYTHFRIEAEVFVCRRVSGRVVLNGPSDYRWVAADDLDAFPFPKANHKFIPLLKRRMKGNTAEAAQDKERDR